MSDENQPVGSALLASAAPVSQLPSVPSGSNGSWLDRSLSWLAPGVAAKREFNRAQASYFRQVREHIPKMSAVYRAQMPTRLDSQWSTTVGFTGANSPLNRWRLTRLRDRARDAERNNPLVKGMLDRAVENVIGRGFDLQPTTKEKNFNSDLKSQFSEWFEDADIRGLSGSNEIQRLMLRCFFRDGDAGCGLVDHGQELKLQMITGDYIDTVSGGYDLSKNILDGIQYNNDGRPLKYFMLEIQADGSRKQAEADADDFVFISRRNSPDQVRGEPCFAQVFQLLDQLDAFVEATIVAARVAACQSLIIQMQNSTTAFNGQPLQINANNQEQRITNMEPGSVRYLRPGETAMQFAPQYPQVHFSDFLTQLLRYCGLTLGLPLELVMMDFSRTNYSSARASLLQAYRSFQTIQKYFGDRCMTKIYRWWLSRSIRNGKIRVPRNLVREQFWAHRWIAPGWAWVDPQKEINGAMMEVDAMMNTLTDILAQHGKDFDHIKEKRAQEIKDLKAAGIPIIHSGMTRDPGTPGKPNDSKEQDDPKSGESGSEEHDN